MYAAMTHIEDASKDADINTVFPNLLAKVFKQTNGSILKYPKSLSGHEFD